jgi:nucleoside-diphosphate-sugar epimerase
VPLLVSRNLSVRVIDTFWFGNKLPELPEIEVLALDVREIERRHLRDVTDVIHLSGIANDPTGDLDPATTWHHGALATHRLLEACAAVSTISTFIYASSGSVYGISSAPQVSEETPLFPISEYNRVKMVCERVVQSFGHLWRSVVLRPATVCGYSPRMRLDLTVNLLTYQALANAEITVLGGQQHRPNVHIEDLCEAYAFFLDSSSPTGTFNVGFENLTVLETAKMISAFVPAAIKVTDSVDHRSYRLDSRKLLSTGYKPKKGVTNAIQELVRAHAEGRLDTSINAYNLEVMKRVLPFQQSHTSES